MSGLWFYSSCTKRLLGFAAAVIVLVCQRERGEAITTLSPWIDAGKWEPAHSLDVNMMSHNMAGLPVRVQALQSVISSLCVIHKQISFQFGIIFFSLEGNAFLFSHSSQEGQRSKASGNHLNVEIKLTLLMWGWRVQQCCWQHPLLKVTAVMCWH